MSNNSHLSSYPNFDEETESSRRLEWLSVNILIVDLDRTDPLTDDRIEEALSNLSFDLRFDLTRHRITRIMMTITANPNTLAEIAVTNTYMSDPGAAINGSGRKKMRYQIIRNTGLDST